MGTFEMLHEHRPAEVSLGRFGRAPVSFQSSRCPARAERPRPHNRPALLLLASSEIAIALVNSSMTVRHERVVMPVAHVAHCAGLEGVASTVALARYGISNNPTHRLPDGAENEMPRHRVFGFGVSAFPPAGRLCQGQPCQSKRGKHRRRRRRRGRAAGFSLGELWAQTSASGDRAANPMVRKRIIIHFKCLSLRFRKRRVRIQTPIRPAILE